MQVGLEGRQQFDSFTREYFKARPNLAMVFTLVDASIPPQKIDLDYVNWLTDNEVPFTLVSLFHRLGCGVEFCSVRNAAEI